MSNFVEDINEIKNELNGIVKDLERYSISFYITGNEIMGEKLSRSSEALVYINKRLEKIIDKKLDKDLEEARKSSAEVFNRYVKPHIT